MDQKLYDLMNWTEVEEIVYSESSNPHAILGPHLREEGLLIQAFLPGAVKAAGVWILPPDSKKPEDARVNRASDYPVHFMLNQASDFRSTCFT